jgi:hypothetical protein
MIRLALQHDDYRFSLTEHRFAGTDEFTVTQDGAGLVHFLLAEGIIGEGNLIVDDDLESEPEEDDNHEEHAEY